MHISRELKIVFEAKNKEPTKQKERHREVVEKSKNFVSSAKGELLSRERRKNMFHKVSRKRI